MISIIYSPKLLQWNTINASVSANSAFGCTAFQLTIVTNCYCSLSRRGELMSLMGDDIARCLSAAQMRAVVVGIVKITGRCLCIYAELLSARLYRCLCWFTLYAICRDTLSPELLFRGRDGIRTPPLSPLPFPSILLKFRVSCPKKFLRPHSFPRQSNNQTIDSGKNIVIIIIVVLILSQEKKDLTRKRILNRTRKEKINYLNNISWNRISTLYFQII